MELSRFDPFLPSALAGPRSSSSLLSDPFDSFFPSSLVSRDMWGAGEQGSRAMTMRVDVKEGDKQYDVVADLPGANKEGRCGATQAARQAAGRQAVWCGWQPQTDRGDGAPSGVWH